MLIGLAHPPPPFSALQEIFVFLGGYLFLKEMKDFGPAATPHKTSSPPYLYLRPMVGGIKNETFETNERKKRRFLFFRGKGGNVPGASPGAWGKKMFPKKVSFVSNLSFHSTYHEM
jgi:hypothetical protein